ncbi:OLC1v1023942C1 [Oldenlandia corymbosa var. corymbosa]|uniref:OLC1v1023942C1 n=1 Tax=Oldenlandia corymbosa var. corymbosa TaxID=529605 RepID=A0AAV1C1W8_OLDCO|nr:OLC1v1023942C1 [Oldenlandia corymbosa var. corymbosa]
MEFDHRITIIIFLSMMGCFASFAQAYTFYVGGRDGWVLNPKEEYNQWASRMRFLINDTLIFKYEKGHDTVLEVNKDDYFNCYKEKPLQALKDGDSVFKFDRPGPFFFISGHADNCAKGQRIITVVLHPRNPPPAPAPVQVPVPAPAVVAAYPPPPPPAPVPVAVPVPTPVVANSPPPAPAAPSPAPEADLAPAPAPDSTGDAAAAIAGGLAMELSFFFMGMAVLLLL